MIRINTTVKQTQRQAGYRGLFGGSYGGGGVDGFSSSGIGFSGIGLRGRFVSLASGFLNRFAGRNSGCTGAILSLSSPWMLCGLLLWKDRGLEGSVV